LSEYLKLVIGSYFVVSPKKLERRKEKSLGPVESLINQLAVMARLVWQKKSAIG
jgi:hypothetical protein